MVSINDRLGALCDALAAGRAGERVEKLDANWIDDLAHLIIHEESVRKKAQDDAESDAEFLRSRRNQQRAAQQPWLAES